MTEMRSSPGREDQRLDYEPSDSYLTPEAAPEIVIVNNSDPSEVSVVVNIDQLVVNLGS